jgi:protease I
MPSAHCPLAATRGFDLAHFLHRRIFAIDAEKSKVRTAYRHFPRRRCVMAGKLAGKRVAILVEKGFEQVELTEPRKALGEAGAMTFVVSPQPRDVLAWDMADWGEHVPVDVPLDSAHAEDFDALLLPGGVINPDRLRINPAAVSFVRDFFTAGKPVAAICHGPWTLIDAGVVEGRKLTSWPSLKTDLQNAGAQWVDQEVVVDQGLVTSRNPADIPAFNQKMLEEIAEGVHAPARS